MTLPSRKQVQIFLCVALALAAVRLYWVHHERTEAGKSNVRGVVASGHTMTSDDYVVPKKFYAYDLRSARELVGKPIWVKQGYGNYIYPVHGSSIDLKNGELTLRPIEKL